MIYIGVDIHARQQTVCYLDTEDGSTRQQELGHEGEQVRALQYAGVSLRAQLLTRSGSQRLAGLQLSVIARQVFASLVVLFFRVPASFHASALRQAKRLRSLHGVER